MPAMPGVTARLLRLWTPASTPRRGRASNWWRKGDGSPTTNPVVRSRRPSRRPDLRSLGTPRAVAVQHARRAPPQAARSVLDGPEHGGIIVAEGRRVQGSRAVYARVFAAANTGSEECRKIVSTTSSISRELKAKK